MDRKYVGPIFDMLKDMYDRGLIDKETVRLLVQTMDETTFVEVAHITPMQYEAITGERY